MGFFDRLILWNFHKDEEGRILFYPWGLMARGYLVDSEATASHIQDFLRMYYVGSLCLLGCALVLTTFAASGVLFLVLCLIYPILLRHRTTGLQRLPRLSNASQTYREAAQQQKWSVLIISVISSAAFVAVGVQVLAAEADSTAARLLILIGALGGMHFLNMIRIKITKD